MGEILRHAEIFKNTRDKIGDLRPDEEYVFIELGNFLTDISQFRDPFANMSAKRTLWKKASAKDPLSYIPILGIFLNEIALDILDVDKWINDLLGEAEPANKRYGDLAKYFEKMMLAITHVVFAKNIPQKDKVRQLLPPEMQTLGEIEPDELNRAFSRFFTQYYPHEHVDLPPFVLHGDQRVRHSIYRHGRRGLIGYLEEQLKYLAEELSKLEADWKSKRHLAKTHPDRHDILIQLGKLLHAVEDYFFHSNYVEIHLWNSLQRTRPSNEPEDTFKQWFAKNVLLSYRNYQGYQGYGVGATDADPDAGDHIRWRRKLMRRLRYPVYNPELVITSQGPVKQKNVLSQETSEPSQTLVYTGGFESKDMFHTMASALENLESLFVKLDNAAEWLPSNLRTDLNIPSTAALRNSELVLIKTLFNTDERTKLAANEDYLDKRTQLHIEQIHSGVYERGIEKLFTAGYLNQSAKDALLEAFAIDKRIEDSNSRTPGVGGFLIAFLAEAQDEVNKSRRATERLDRTNTGQANEGDISNEATDNGSSAEIIGTYTLLAKDTPKSQPLYEDAKVLAKFASLSLVTLMLTEVERSTDSTTGLDWLQILEQVVRFPHARPNMWEPQVLAFYRQAGIDPAFNDIANRPTAQLIQLSDPNQRLNTLRNGTARVDLEKKYTDLEKRADKFMLLNIIPG